MNEIIRVLVRNPSNQSNVLACLRRPLVWDEVVQELYAAMEDTDVVLSQEDIKLYKIVVYPTKNRDEKGVTVRRNILDPSIRDGDMVSLAKVEKSSKTRSPSGRSMMPAAPTEIRLTSTREVEMLQANNNNNSSTQNSLPLKNSKRPRSLSSRFWLINRFATSGLITKEQKETLKSLLIAGDDQDVDRAFHKYEETGDIRELLQVFETKKLNKNIAEDNPSNTNSQWFGAELGQQFAPTDSSASIDHFSQVLDSIDLKFLGDMEQPLSSSGASSSGPGIERMNSHNSKSPTMGELRVGTPNLCFSNDMSSVQLVEQQQQQPWETYDFDAIRNLFMETSSSVYPILNDHRQS